MSSYADPYFLRMITEHIQTGSIDLEEPQSVPFDLQEELDRLWLSLPIDYDFLAHRMLSVLALLQEPCSDELLYEILCNLEIFRDMNKHVEKPLPEDVSRVRASFSKWLVFSGTSYMLLHDRLRRYIAGSLFFIDPSVAHSVSDADPQDKRDSLYEGKLPPHDIHASHMLVAQYYDRRGNDENETDLYSRLGPASFDYLSYHLQQAGIIQKLYYPKATVNQAQDLLYELCMDARWEASSISTTLGYSSYLNDLRRAVGLLSLPSDNSKGNDIRIATLMRKAGKTGEQAKSDIRPVFEWIMESPAGEGGHDARMRRILKRLDVLDGKEYFVISLLLILLETERQKSLPVQERKVEELEKLSQAMDARMADTKNSIKWGDLLTKGFMVKLYLEADEVFDGAAADALQPYLVRDNTQELFETVGEISKELCRPGKSDRAAPLTVDMLDSIPRLELDSDKQNSLEALAAGLSTSTDSKSLVQSASRILDTAETIENEVWRDCSLGKIATQLCSNRIIQENEAVFERLIKAGRRADAYFGRERYLPRIASRLGSSGTAAGPAERLCTEVLEKAERIKNTKKREQSLAEIVGCLWRTGNSKRAENILQTISSPEERSRAFMNLGSACFDLGETEKAYQFFLSSLNEITGIHYDMKSTILLDDFSSIVASPGLDEEKYRLLREALKIGKEIKPGFLRCEAISHIATGLVEMGAIEEGIANVTLVKSQPWHGDLLCTIGENLHLVDEESRREEFTKILVDYTRSFSKENNKTKVSSGLLASDIALGDLKDLHSHVTRFFTGKADTDVSVLNDAVYAALSKTLLQSGYVELATAAALKIDGKKKSSTRRSRLAEVLRKLIIEGEKEWAKELLGAEKDKKLESITHMYEGEELQRQGSQESALELYRRSGEAARSISGTRKKLNGLTEVGASLSRGGYRAEATKLFLEAFELTASLKDDKSRYESISHITAAILSNDTSPEKEIAEEALDKTHSIGNSIWRAYAIVEAVELLCAAGEEIRAEDVAKSIDDDLVELQRQRALSKVAVTHAKNREEDESSRLLRMIDNEEIYYAARCDIAASHHRAGNREYAGKELGEIHAEIHSLPPKKEREEGLSYLAKTYASLGLFEEALSTAAEIHSVKQRADCLSDVLGSVDSCSAVILFSRYLIDESMSEENYCSLVRKLRKRLIDLMSEKSTEKESGIFACLRKELYRSFPLCPFSYRLAYLGVVQLIRLHILEKDMDTIKGIVEENPELSLEFLL